MNLIRVLAVVLILLIFTPITSCQLLCSIFKPVGPNFQFGDPFIQPNRFSIWAFGDAHVKTELRNDYRSLESSIRDSLFGGDEGGQHFEWDIAINPGDYAGGQECPEDRQGEQIIEQFTGARVDRNRIYSVIGNHDENFGDASWFNKWIDPLGENTDYSGVDNEKRPFETSGQWDHYSFQAGNIQFLMLGDHNFGGHPFGRECFHGAPAGRYSKESYDWWVDQVENNQDKIIITVAHHALLETTIYTGLFEGATRDEINEKVKIHGDVTWADRRGSSFIYAIDNWTIDGLNENQEFIGERPYGFKKYLQEHPGAIDFWIHGHTHHTLFPGKEYTGRTDVEFVDGVWFINAGAIAKFHGAPDVPFSRLFEFNDDSNEVLMKTYLHISGWNGNPEGFYLPAERIFELDKAFQAQ